jgi:hypothetical protein
MISAMRHTLSVNENVELVSFVVGTELVSAYDLGGHGWGRERGSTNGREWIGRCVRFGLNMAPFLEREKTVPRSNFRQVNVNYI